MGYKGKQIIGYADDLGKFGEENSFFTIRLLSNF